MTTLTAAGAAAPRARQWVAFRWLRLLRAAAAIVLMALAGLAALGPAVLPDDPNQGDLRLALQEPVGFGGEWRHPLGTDELGRDQLARLASGARTSLLIAAAVVAVSAAAGIALGVLAGLLGGLVDAFVTEAIDLFIALPLLLVAVAISGALEPGRVTVILTLALLTWPVFARLVRMEIRRLQNADFVVAARAIGCGPGRVAAAHLLPNLLTSVLVVTSLQLTSVIVVEASMSFVRLGVPPTTVSWGGMLADGRDYLGLANWLVALPAAAIALTCLAINVVTDWLTEHVAH